MQINKGFTGFQVDDCPGYGEAVAGADHRRQRPLALRRIEGVLGIGSDRPSPGEAQGRGDRCLLGAIARC